MTENITIRGVIKKISLRAENYGIKLDDGEWYNEWGDIPGGLAEGIPVEIGYVIKDGYRTIKKIKKIDSKLIGPTPGVPAQKSEAPAQDEEQIEETPPSPPKAEPAKTYGLYEEKKEIRMVRQSAWKNAAVLAASMSGNVGMAQVIARAKELAHVIEEDILRPQEKIERVHNE